VSIAVTCQTVPDVPCRRPDVEAVDADQLARARSLDLRIGLTRARRLVGGSIASDERKALVAGVQSVPA